jgi:hypothetical protein
MLRMRTAFGPTTCPSFSEPETSVQPSSSMHLVYVSSDERHAQKIDVQPMAGFSEGLPYALLLTNDTLFVANTVYNPGVTIS